jgi:hypothetical protein
MRHFCRRPRVGPATALALVVLVALVAAVAAVAPEDDVRGEPISFVGSSRVHAAPDARGGLQQWLQDAPPML